MRRTLLMTMLVCLGLALLVAGPAGAAQMGELKIQPGVLDIGTFYSGGEVKISGEVPEGKDVIVEIAGPVSNSKFDLKGRVGPFWMTRGKAELDGAPSMYILLLPGGSDWRREASSLGVGLDKLRDNMSIQSAMMAPDDIFSMFLKLKKTEGLYVEKDNAVTYASDDNGDRRFTAVYRFPRSTSKGKYTIKATAVANGSKGVEVSSSFMVNEVGFVRVVDDLSSNRRVVYGVLAVIIALLAGGVMGYLFKGGGSH